MKTFKYLSTLLSLLIVAPQLKAQTSKDIQDSWRMVSTSITNSRGEIVYRMDSTTHNLTKVITSNRMLFTIYNLKTNSLEISGQGKATTRGNEYVETFEQSTSKSLLQEPIFTYKIQGDRWIYEGGSKHLHIIEVLKRVD